MKQWKVEYWTPGKGKSPVEKWLDKLSKEQLRSLAKEIMMLEQVGNELKLPHSRAIGKGLFELRERRFGFRVYYGFKGDFVVIMLTAGDKKSQEKDIVIARKRLSELKEE
jgi:putative addiction module killer protein